MLFRRPTTRSWLLSQLLALALLSATITFSGCRKPAAPATRTFQLKGQIVAIDPARQELTVKHDDIAGFMPAMTMPYAVRDPNLMKGRTPGELITATLVVEETTGYLSAITHEGAAPLSGEKP